MASCVPLNSSTVLRHFPQLLVIAKTRSHFPWFKLIPVAKYIANDKDLEWNTPLLQGWERVTINVFVCIVECNNRVRFVAWIIVVQVDEAESPHERVQLLSEPSRRNPPLVRRDDVNLVIHQNH